MSVDVDLLNNLIKDSQTTFYMTTNSCQDFKYMYLWVSCSAQQKQQSSLCTPEYRAIGIQESFNLIAKARGT